MRIDVLFFIELLKTVSLRYKYWLDREMETFGPLYEDFSQISIISLNVGE